MPKTLSFYQIEKDGATFVVDQNYLAFLAEGASHSTGVEYAPMTDEDITTLYGDAATRRTVTLKPNSYRLRLDMQRLAARKDDQKGLGADESLMPAARVAATVESWNLVTVDGKDAEISVEGFLDLPLPVADYVDSQVIGYLNPDIIRDADFLALFSSKCKPSETKTEAA